MSHGSLTPPGDLAKLIAWHIKSGSVRGLLYVRTLIEDRVMDAERMGWVALRESWTDSLSIVDEALRELGAKQKPAKQAQAVAA